MNGVQSVLVIGGRGAFGRHLVEGILATTDWVVIVAGRDGAAGNRFATDLRDRFGTARVEVVALDRDLVTPSDLAKLAITCVVDAAGPFQGQQPTVARAAIAAGVHYLDLADARDFVAGFGYLDSAAQAAGVVARTGASSTPALSNAVLDHLTSDWRRIDDVLVAILPGNRAPRGLAVIRSILSYAGRPVRLFNQGRWRTAPGWSLIERRLVPGLESLGPRFMSLCETPDLDLIPERFQPTRSAVFKAGLELGVMHGGLWLLSWLVRLGIAGSLQPIARLLASVADGLEPLGSDRGGMLVEATGTDAWGARVRARWTLLAEAGSGPNIPTLPALAALKALARGELRAGAGPLVGELSYDLIACEFDRFPITTQTSNLPLPHVFEAALGEDFRMLPTAVRALHASAPAARFEGRAEIDGPDGLVCRVVHVLMRLPKTGSDVAVSVDIAETRAGAERWTRTFAGRRFSSRLVASPQAQAAVEERFGPVRVRLALHPSDRRLVLAVAGWSLWVLPLPMALAPKSEAIETVDDAGRFRFDVAISLPFFGRLVRYRGWLVAVALPQCSDE